jgi:hypothetical protein
MGSSKPNIGFKTPARDIQDAFAEVQKELAKTKVDWQNVHRLSYRLTGEYISDVKSRLNSGKIVPWSKIAVVMQSLTTIEISKLGIELTQVHERLAKCEKAIRDLKLVKR